MLRKLLIFVALMLTTSWAMAENPYIQPDDTWISISGTVDSVSPDIFLLDYGDGSIYVEMDDLDRDADAYKLDKGNKVTVTGMIDDDFFDLRTIEAGSVFVEKLGTTFFSSAIDEEDPLVTIMYPINVVVPVDISQTRIEGTVTNVYDEEFTLDSGVMEITVEVEEMLYNPLDDEGYQKIQVGDRVLVFGEIDQDLFEGTEIVADSVITLNKTDNY